MKEQLKTLQADIKDLLEQIKWEKDYLKPVKVVIGDKLEFTNKEFKEDKNYSDTRKLVCTLEDMLNTYMKLNNNIFDEFVVDFSKELISESESVHKLKVDSLHRKNNEQYRCLSSIYTMLLEMVNKIERSKNISYYTTRDLNISGRPETKDIDEKNEIKCVECNVVKNSRNFYKHFHDSNKHIKVCKNCLKEKINEGSNGYIFDLFRVYNVPYIQRLWLKSDNNIGIYFNKLSYNGYRGLGWSASNFDDLK